MEGVQGEEGAGNGAVRGIFRDLLRWVKQDCQESRHFSQWLGEMRRFLMTRECRDARPRCQSQRGLADSVVSLLGSGGISRRRILGILLRLNW